jgi:hypothetical protein
LQAREELLPAGIPQPHAAVESTRHEGAAIETERNAPHRPAVAFEHR